MINIPCVVIIHDFALLLDEREILFELFANNNGPAWTKNSNWGSSLPLNCWECVIVDKTHGLSKLTLAENNLAGNS